MASLLAVVNLYCERDERVLFRDLSFSLESGELMQIEGPNGSGKTTLLKILAGLNQRYTGEVFWQGQDRLNVFSEYLLAVNYFGHLAGIKLTLTPLENLLWYAGLTFQASTEAIEAALFKVGLAGFEDVPCHYLSAGQKRRVALARLLLRHQPLWILDEPFTAIDKNGVAMIESMMSRHVQEGGSVLFTTHQDVAMEYPIRRVNLGDYSG